MRYFLVVARNRSEISHQTYAIDDTFLEMSSHIFTICDIVLEIRRVVFEISDPVSAMENQTCQSATSAPTFP